MIIPVLFLLPVEYEIASEHLSQKIAFLVDGHENGLSFIGVKRAKYSTNVFLSFSDHGPG